MKNITSVFYLVFPLALLISACGGSDNDTPYTPPPPAAQFEPGTYPRFDPIVSDIPFNTDLIFAAAATSDGTANVGAATDPVRAAVNMLDGFSTSAFFDILIEGSVDPASVVPLQSVFLIEVNTGGKDALNPANILGLVGPASFDTRVVSLDGGSNNVIRIRPTLPLKAKTKYLVFITNDVRDAQGQPLTASWTYNALGDPSYAVLGALEPVRTAILGWEQMAGGFLQAVSGGQLGEEAAKAKLVLSYTFTTTDPMAPLIAMASPRAAVASLQIAAGVPAQTAVANVVTLDGLGLLPTPKARDLGISPLTGVDLGALTQGAVAADVAKLYTGYIKLPYYQTAPDGLPFGAFLSQNWKPDLTLAGALGVTVPADVDGSYNVTYRYPFAARSSEQSFPLQLTLPEADFVPGYAGAATCGQVYAETGYPVVIYMHGITLDRSSGAGLSHTLASRCIATVAIDLPMHGVAANNAFVTALNVEHSQLIPFAALYGNNLPRERHFNVAGQGGAPAPMNFESPGANDGSGAQFVNLGYLANTRDNNRQAVMDLLNLNASLGNIHTVAQGMGAPGLDLDRVYLVGVSLGSILGSVFVTVNELAIANDAQVGLTSNLNPIRGVVASTPGTQVSQILVNSQTFGPVINGGLAAAGVNQGTSNYERFLYAAQSTVDSGDPVNFLQRLKQLNVPVLIQQVNGDLVMPNAPDSAPLGGTYGFIQTLDATQMGLGSDQLVSQSVVKMTAGDHVSLIRPATDAPQITAEFQTQVVTFVLNDGRVSIGAGAPGNVELPE